MLVSPGLGACRVLESTHQRHFESSSGCFLQRGFQPGLRGDPATALSASGQGGGLMGILHLFFLFLSFFFFNFVSV